MNRSFAATPLLLVACSSGTANLPPPAEPVAAPALDATTTPAAVAEAAPGGWVDEAKQLGLERPRPGVLSYARTDDGSVVAALSYTSDAHPFRMLRKGPGDAALAEAPAPWKCDAGPAEIEASGHSFWIHCIDPSSDKPHVHFWHSDDAGRTWSRAGALMDGPLAVGRYALCGSTLFASGTFEGMVSPLHKVTRAGGRWAATPAKPTPSDALWKGDTVQAVVASEDCTTLALVGETTLPGKGPRLVVSLSHDGGASFGGVTEAPWGPKRVVLSWSLVQKVLSLTVDASEGSFLGVVRAGVDGPLAAVEPLAPTSLHDAEACAHGANVIARTRSGWMISNDGGKTFAKAPSPKANESSGPIQCAKDGARTVTELLRWK